MDHQLRTEFTVQPGTSKFLDSGPKKLLIGGEWVTAQSGEVFATHDPCTGLELGELARARVEDVDLAVAAARTALEDGPWAGFSATERGQILWRAADLIEAHIEELSEIETLDQGKPKSVGRWAEIPGAIEQFRFFAGEATKIEGKTIPTSINYQPEGKQIFAYTRKEPVGIVGAIVPWNSPIVLTAMKIAPALAAGCTMVLKPAEDTSLSAVRLGELLQQAGLPAGVLNIITGFGIEAGAALAAHHDVDKVSFTGSTTTGRAIIEAAKGNLKKVALELGGKSPVVIMEDADLDLAIPGAANAIFFNSGQVCVAGSRLYVHRSVFDKVVSGIVAIAENIKLGHGLDENAQMGPLVNPVHCERVLGFINRAKAAGAKIECGGVRDEEGASFIKPTVISGVTDEMEIVREEVFGPVLVVSAFDTISEVEARANDSAYGLGASIWTESLSAAHRTAARIKAGTVWINCHSMYDASLPIGGIKQSGWGADSGRQAVENYLDEKSICAVI